MHYLLNSGCVIQCRLSDIKKSVYTYIKYIFLLKKYKMHFIWEGSAVLWILFLSIGEQPSLLVEERAILETN